MRALHLCFWLHHPYELNESSRWQKGYFGGEEDFRRVEREDYQPLFAVLERNAQRYSNLRVSLAVSGVWLEQAERWGAELIERLRKLVRDGNVELVGVPYYMSMAGFYDLEELKAQVEQHRAKTEEVFGVKPEVLALPELAYHNKLARWAEKLGFRGILAGDARGALDWRTVNRLYDAKGCEKVRVMFENVVLSEAITTSSPVVTVKIEDEVKVQQMEEETPVEVAPTTAMDFVRGLSESQANDKAVHETKRRATESVVKNTTVKMRTIFSAKMLQKQLDLAFLRGDLVNLVLEPEIFGKWRSRGIVGFFDELIKIWSETPGNKLVGVDDILRMPVTAEISVKKTATSRGEAGAEYALPGWWGDVEVRNSKELYGMRRDVLAAKDQDLYVDFAKLTAGAYAEGGDNYRAILADLKRRVGELVSKPEDSGVPVSRGLTESTTVKINFQKKPEPEGLSVVEGSSAEAADDGDMDKDEAQTLQSDIYEQFKQAAGLVDEEGRPFWAAEDMDDMEAAIQVLAQRMKWTDPEREREFDDLAEAEVVGEVEVGAEIEFEDELDLEDFESDDGDEGGVDEDLLDDFGSESDDLLGDFGEEGKASAEAFAEDEELMGAFEGDGFEMDDLLDDDELGVVRDVPPRKQSGAMGGVSHGASGAAPLGKEKAEKPKKKFAAKKIFKKIVID